MKYKNDKVNIIFICGIPASGKTTLRNNILKNDKKEFLLCSRDEIRRNLFGNYTINKENENIVSIIEEELIKSGLFFNKNIIIDNTITKIQYLKRYFNLIKKYKLKNNINVVLHDLRDVDINVCLNRNSKRNEIEKVPDSVIRSMYNTFLSNKKEWNDIFYKNKKEIENDY